MSRLPTDSIPRDLAVCALRYGMTVDFLVLMYERQGGLCAVCKTQLYDRFNVDHDHTCCEVGDCGECVRGLLCSRCNLGIGMLGDNFVGVMSAAIYLRKYENRRADFIGQFKEALNA